MLLDPNESVFGAKGGEFLVGRIDSQTYATGTAHGSSGDLTGRRK